MTPKKTNPTARSRSSSNESNNSRPPARSPISAAMDFLARRNHSELELRQKLKKRYEAGDVDKAIEYCREQNWLMSPESLADQTMNALHRRKKGFLFIQRYLRQKGLPVPKKEDAREEEKIREIVDRKFRTLTDMKSKQKAYRFLKSRGFEDNLIRKVLYAANDRS